MTPVLTLRSGRDRSVRRRHPWILSGSVKRVSPGGGAGDVVRVVSAGGEELGWAAFSAPSSLRVRMLTFDPDDEPGDLWIGPQVRAAADRRHGRDDERLLFSEADGLPGVITDRYGSVAVIQLGTPWADRQRDVLLHAFSALPGV